MKRTFILILLIILFSVDFLLAVQFIYKDRKGHFLFECVRGPKRGRVEVQFLRTGFKVKIGGRTYSEKDFPSYLYSPKKGQERMQIAMELGEEVCLENVQ